MVYDHINLTLTDFAPDSPFSIAASVHLPGQGAEEIRLQGNGGPVQQAEPATTPFHGSLDLKGVSIAGLQKFFKHRRLPTRMGSCRDIRILPANREHSRRWARWLWTKLRVRGSEVGYPITADYEVNDDLIEQPVQDQ